MLNLLIVEDQWDTRQGLLTMIDWSSLGIQVCGQVENGRMALDLLDSHIVDIVLTDIRMPVMDGFQLIDEIKHRNLQIPIVLLTGHSDFEYAQKALRMGVSDYIIKPCSPEEITRIFRSIISKIFKRNQQNEDWERLQDTLKHNLPIIKSKVLLQWLKEGGSSTENRFEKLGKLNISILRSQFQVLLLNVDGGSVQKLGYGQRDKQLINFAAFNIVGETLIQVLGPLFEIVQDGDNIIIILDGANHFKWRTLEDSLQRLRGNLKEYLGITISIGISDLKQNINQLNDASVEAYKALMHRFYRGEECTVYYNEVKIGTEYRPDNQAEKEIVALVQEILGELKMGLYVEALNKLDKWFSLVEAKMILPPTKVSLQTIALLSQFIHFTKELHNVDWLERFTAMVNKVSQIETLDQLSKYVYSLVHKIIENINIEKKTTP